MILLILECILIVASMMRSIAVGLSAWALIVVIVYTKKENWVDFWIMVLITSLPISYLTIFYTEGVKIFKWYNFSVLGLDLTIFLKMVKRKVKVNLNIFITLFSILSVQLCRNLLLQNLNHIFIELMQEYITVITVWMFYQYIRMGEETATSLFQKCEKWTGLYLNVTLASGIGVILQKMVYQYAGTIIGAVTIFEKRQVFDMTFTGYSVLSAFLGGGMVIAINNLLHGNKKILSFIQFVFLAFACVVNSSRSGLIAAIIIILIMLLISFKKYSTAKRTLLFGLPILAGMLSAMTYLMQTRLSLQSVGLLTDNGRFVLVEEVIRIMLSSISTFLFGIGINGQYSLGVSSQHNMFLEIWELNGTLIAIPFVIAVIMIIWSTRRRKNKYLLWQLLLAHQFYSSFFATTFVPVVLILTISSGLEGGKETNVRATSENNLIYSFFFNN